MDRDAPSARIAELEAQLATVTTERDQAWENRNMLRRELDTSRAEVLRLNELGKRQELAYESALDRKHAKIAELVDKLQAERAKSAAAVKHGRKELERAGVMGATDGYAPLATIERMLKSLQPAAPKETPFKRCALCTHDDHAGRGCEYGPVHDGIGGCDCGWPKEDCATDKTTPRWRTGQTLGRTLYRDDVIVGMVDSREIAEEIVARMNASATDKATLACPSCKGGGCDACHHSGWAPGVTPPKRSYGARATDKTTAGPTDSDGQAQSGTLSDSGHAVKPVPNPTDGGRPSGAAEAGRPTSAVANSATTGMAETSREPHEQRNDTQAQAQTTSVNSGVGTPSGGGVGSAPSEGHGVAREAGAGAGGAGGLSVSSSVQGASRAVATGMADAAGRMTREELAIIKGRLEANFDLGTHPVSRSGLIGLIAAAERDLDVLRLAKEAREAAVDSVEAWERLLGELDAREERKATR